MSENAAAVGATSPGDARGQPTVLDLQSPSNRAAQVRRVLRLGHEALRLMSDSGKPTLVKRICQLYRRKGCILWNGIDSRSCPRKRLATSSRSLSRTTSSTAFRRTNRRRATRPCRRSRAGGAGAEQAGAARFLTSLHGIRPGRRSWAATSSLGGAAAAAGGRAGILPGGNFLIHEEPATSLDPHAEAELFAQMRQLADGRSVLVVSHRLSTVRSGDPFYVLEHGQVGESETHEELMALGGAYTDLFNRRSRRTSVGPGSASCSS